MSGSISASAQAEKSRRKKGGEVPYGVYPAQRANSALHLPLTHQFPWGQFGISKLASIPGGIIGRAALRYGLLTRNLLETGQI